jgi:hypothetical protein
MLEAERFTMVASTGGRLELVAIAQRNSKSPEAIWHATETPQNGDRAWWSTWTNWRSLGSPEGQLKANTEPAAAVNADGRLEIAVVGTEVFHAWQHPGGDWSDWHSLKKPRELEPGSLLGGSTLASNEDGRLELFTKVLESDGTLWHRWQPEPGRGPWRDWHSLGRPPGTGGFALSEAPPALASNLDGRLELFVLVNDDAVWHRWQKVPNGGWSPWKSLEKPATGLQGEPAVVRNHDGRLELFSWDEEGTVWHRWQTKPGRGPWAAWASLGGVPGSASINSATGSPVTSKVVAGTHSDGRLLLFTIINPQGDPEIWQQEQTARNNGWLPEWRLQNRASQLHSSAGSSITSLSTPVLTSETTRGRPLLCSVASGTGLFAGERTPLFLVGYPAHSGEMTIGDHLLKRPPLEAPTSRPHPD